MTRVPTRWKTLFEDQVNDAGDRVAQAKSQLADSEGGRALQAAYQAVVGAATVRVWLKDHPWERPLPQDEFQRRTTEAFPNQFAALATLDLKDVLTSSWTAQAARPYIEEAETFVKETRDRLETWLAQA